MAVFASGMIGNSAGMCKIKMQSKNYVIPFELIQSTNEMKSDSNKHSFMSGFNEVN